MKNIFVFCFLSFLFSEGISQQVWTLEKCILYAQENNIRLKQQELDTRFMKNNLFKSKMDLLPDINASASQNYSYGRALDETTYEFTENQEVASTNVNLNSRVTLFNGLQQYNTIRQEEFNFLSGLQRLEQSKNNLSLNIASAYLQILFSTELLEVAENQLVVTNLQVDRTSKLVEAGSLPRGSLYEIQSQAAAEEVQIINARNQLEIDYLSLTQLLDLDTLDSFAIYMPEFGDIVDDEIIYTVREIYETALTVLPEIKAAEYNLMSAEKGLVIARGGRYPSLYMGVSFGTGYSDIRQRVISTEEITLPVGQTINGVPVTTTSQVPVFDNYPFTDQFSDNASTVISFSLNVPILNGWFVNNAVSNSKLNVLNEIYELENTEKDLYKEIQQAYADALGARKKYVASTKALQAMRESFNYTEQKYEVGLVNGFDYNAAKNQLTRTESDLLQAKYDYIFRIKILDYYRGIPLSLEEI